MAMKRNDIVNVWQLVDGDRFYRVKDKQKTVLEFDKMAYNDTIAIAWTINGNNTRQKVQHIKAPEQVVFLRNTSDKYAEDIRKITDRQENKGNTDQVL